MVGRKRRRGGGGGGGGVLRRRWSVAEGRRRRNDLIPRQQLHERRPRDVPPRLIGARDVVDQDGCGHALRGPALVDNPHNIADHGAHVDERVQVLLLDHLHHVCILGRVTELLPERGGHGCHGNVGVEVEVER
eukprot:7990125-Pyramimonas_sp.AAC.1